MEKNSKQSSPRLSPRAFQSGNVFAMLFGAVALTGVLASVGMQTLTGPVTTITRVTQKNIADTQLLMDAKIIINAAVSGVAGGDPDADGIIEPAAFVAPGGSDAPTNGGFLPTTLGLSLTDPWGTRYGYCVWDHGSTNSSANRVTGDNTASATVQPVIAIIAAGPDKAFQTTCSAYAGGNVDATKASGSDDLIFKYTYAEASANSNGLWSINTGDQAKAELKDSAGSSVNVSIDRDTGIGDFLGVTTSVISAKVSETVSFDGSILLDADGSGTATVCDASRKGAIRLNTTKDAIEVCDGTSAFVDLTGGTWETDGTHVWRQTGNVGIGTASPGYPLDVQGNANISGNIIVGGTGSVTGNFIVNTDAISVDATNKRLGIGKAAPSEALDVVGNAYIQGDGVVTGGLTVDTNTLFVDATNDYVGIGTLSPAHVFDVVGATDMGALGSIDTSAAVVHVTDGTANLYADGRAILSDTAFIVGTSEAVGFQIATDEVARLSVAAGGDVNISSNLGVGGNTSISGTLNVTQGTGLSSTLSVLGNATFDTNTLFVDASSDVVGIGTVSPGAKLEVVGGVKIGLHTTCAVGGTNNGTIQYEGTVKKMQVCVDGVWSSLAAIEKLDDIGNVAISEVGTPNNNDLLAWNSSQNRWEAKNISSVGAATVNVAGSDGSIQFRDGSDLGADASNLHFDDTNDRLGIGTNSPDTILHLKQGSGTATITLETGSGKAELAHTGANMTLTNTATGGDTTFYTEDEFSFWTGGTSARRFSVAGTGQVRIGAGTGTPGALLEVEGGIKLGDDTGTCDGTKEGTLRYNTSTLQICISGQWSDVGSGGGGGGLGETMISGWPDAINCGATDPSLYYLTYAPFSDGKYYYRNIWHNSDISVTFLANKSYDSKTTADTGCDSKTINVLYAQGRAYNFVGGNSTGDDTNMVTNVPDAINCGVSGTQRFLYLQSSTASAYTYALSGGASGLGMQVVYDVLPGGTHNSTTNTAGWTNANGCDAKTLTQLASENRTFNLAGGSGGGGGGGGSTPAGSDGYIQYNTSGVLDAESALFWDAANDRLGVGTTTPAATVEIAGGVKLGADATCTVAKAGTIVYNSGVLRLCNSSGALEDIAVGALALADGAAGRVQISDGSGGFTSDGNLTFSGGTLNVATALSVSGTLGVTGDATLGGDLDVSDGFTADGTTLVVDAIANDVGIGTASPGAKLEVVGGIKLGSDSDACDGSKAGTIRYAGGEFETCKGTAWEAIGTGSGSGKFIDGTDTNDAVYTGSGNVGIGTATPVSKLDVVGGIKLGDDTDTCVVAKVGTLRFSSGKMQICNEQVDTTYDWNDLATVSGLAPPDPEEEPFNNIFPDAFRCSTSGETRIFYAFDTIVASGQRRYRDQNNNNDLTFDTDGAFVSMGLSGTDCEGKTVAELKTAGNGVDFKSGTAATMIAGWPDIVRCTYSGNYHHFYLSWYNATSVRYREFNSGAVHDFITSTKTEYNRSWNTDCNGLTTTQLYSNGQAYNMVGGDQTGAIEENFPDAILCTAGTGVQMLLFYNQVVLGSGYVRYQSSHTSNNNYTDFRTDTGQQISGQENVPGTSDCELKNLDTLRTENKTFNFVDNADVKGTGFGTGGGIPGSGSGDPLVAGWPDLIICKGPSNEDYVLRYSTAYIQSGQTVRRYRASAVGAYMDFWPDKTYYTQGTVGNTDCSGANLTDLETAGKTRNYKENVAEGEIMPGWPDGFHCLYNSNSEWPYLYSHGNASYVWYYDYAANYRHRFNRNGTFYDNTYTTTCSSKSVAQLKSEGKSFNFYGGTDDGTVKAGLPDAIKCTVTANGGQRVYYRSISYLSNDTPYYNTMNGNQIRFNGTAPYSYYNGDTDVDCTNKSIAQLTVDGKTIGLVNTNNLGSLPGAYSPAGGSVVDGWPDAIMCRDPNNDPVVFKFSWQGATYTRYTVGYTSSGAGLEVYYLDFNNNKTYNGTNWTTECVGQSVSDLEDLGLTFNFAGGGGGGSNAQGSQGQIQFKNGSGLGADGGLTWDNTNKRLGIGLSNPAMPFEVVGGIKIGNDVTTCAAGIAGSMRWNGTNLQLCNGTSWGSVGGGGGGGGSAAGVAGAIQFSDGASTFLSDDTGLVWDDTNNRLGIGVAVATSVVQIHESTTADILLTNDVSGATATDGLRIAQSGANATINNREAGDLRFSTNDTEYLTILASGDVGIGVTSPVAKLDINGPIKIGTSATCDAGGANNGTIRFDGAGASPSNNVQLCLDGSWSNLNAGSGSGGGSSMVAGWPDAVMCMTDNGDGNSALLRHTWGYPDGRVMYALGWSSTAYGTRWNADGSYEGNWGLANYDCNDHTMQELHAMGRTFNFVGGGSSGGALGTNASMFDGYPDAIRCIAGTSTSTLFLTATATSGATYETTSSAVGGTRYYVSYDTSGNYVGHSGMGSFDCVTDTNFDTLNELYVADRAFNLASGSAVAAGTAGYVQFSNGGNLEWDSNFFWDNTNKRLGIGTTSPTDSLTVNGGNGIQFSDGSLTFRLGEWIDNANTRTWTHLTRGAASGSYGSMALGDLWVSGDQSELPGQAAWFGDKVAIGPGTTAAVAMLDVQGGIKSGADATCNASKAGMLAWNSNTLQLCTNTGSFINVANAVGVTTSAAGTTGQLQFNASNVLAADTSLHWDNTNKRLGLGSATPGARLWVEIDNSTAYTNVAPSSTNLNMTLANTAGHVTGGTFAGMQFNVSGNSENRVGYIGGISESTGNRNMSLVFGTDDDGSRTEKMRITSAGNVGVGTITPSYRLEVANSSAPGMSIRFTGSASTGNKGALYFTHNRNTDSAQEILSYIQGIAEDNQSQGGLRFVTRTGGGSDVETMRMLQTGAVGIGTTTPQATLDVNGGVRLGTTSTCAVGGANNGTLRFNGANIQVCIAGTWGSIGGGGGGGGGTGTTQYSGFPDAMFCTYSGVDSFFMYIERRFADGDVRYTWPGSTSYWVRYNADGSFDSHANMASSGPAPCVSQTIAQLYANGQGYNFVGGGGTSGGSQGTNASMMDGVPDAVQCSDGTNSLTLFLTNQTATSTVYELTHSELTGTRTYVQYDTNGDVFANGNLSTYDCVNDTAYDSIAELYSQDRAFNLGASSAMSHGTNGYLQFANNGNLLSDANIVWDNTNKRLGIGTASPNAPLNVGNVGASATVAGFRGSTYNQLNIAHAGNAAWGLLLGNSDATLNTGYHYSSSGVNSSTSIINVSNDAMHLGTNNTSRMMIHHTGSVAIGTNFNAVPNAQLDVVGGIKMGADATCNAGKAGMMAWNSNTLQVCTNTGAFVNIANAAGVTSSAAGLTGQIQFNTSDALNGDAELFWDNANKRLGVGTSAPASMLHVLGASDVTTFPQAPHNAVFTSNNAFAQGVGGGIVLGGRYNATTETTFGVISGVKENGTSGNYAGALVFGARPSGAIVTEDMRISSAGNVGIGTNAPLQRLHVNDAGALVDARMESDSYSKISWHVRNGSADQRKWQAYAQASGDKWLLTTINDAENAATVAMEVNSGASATVASVNFPSSSVGIGTTTPQAALDVNGGVRLGTTATCAVGGANNGTLRYDSSNVQVCTNGTWNAIGGGGGGGSGSSMLTSWPDVVLCVDGSDVRPMYMRHSSATYTEYADPLDNNTYRYYVRYNPDGSYQTHSRMGSYECVTLSESIADLYSNSRAFNFAGGGTSGGSQGTNASSIEGWPDAINCSGTAGNVLMKYVYSDVSLGRTEYVSAWTSVSGDQNLRLQFNTADGTYHSVSNTASWTNWYTSCVGTSIATHYSNGDAFNWAASSAMSHGSNGYLQFANNGNLLSDAGIVWDNSAKRLTLTGAGGFTISGNTSGGDLTIQDSNINTSRSAGLFLMWTDNTKDINFQRNKVVFKGDGSVGIGTISPVTRLDVVGGAIKTGTDTTCNAGKAGMLAWNANTLQLCTNTGAFVNIATASGVGSASGSEGYVQFNGSSALASDAGFFWDNTNKRLGVGTTTPRARMTVVGGSQTGTLTNFTQDIANAGVAIRTDYSASTYTPGYFWYTENNNNTKPKAGLWMYQTSGGTSLQLGTSNNYATGITNTALHIGPTGDVGIGNTAPSQKLDVSGTVKATAFLNTSDRTLKDNIETTKGLEIIRRLRGVSFVWKENGNEALGLIAQEVEDVLPRAVVTDKNGIKSVDYIMMIAPMIEAIKELDAEVSKLRIENTALKTRVDTLEGQVKSLEERLKAIEEKLK